MSLSFKEKSIYGSLIAILLVFGYYFKRIFEMSGAGGATAEGVLGLIIGVVVALVLVEIAYHVAIAVVFVRQAEDPEDERDRLIDARAERIASFLLGAAVITAIGWILFRELATQTAGAPAVPPLAIAHVLLLAVVASQVLKYLAQLYFYRRGV